MQKKAIVTGASSGIGREIACRLVEDGWYVYGIGRNFADINENRLENPGNAAGFEKVICDITDTNKLVDTIKRINKNHDINLLINNAGTAYYGLHEELNPFKISTMVRTNLEAPMIMCNILLRDLKKNNGTIINITSVTAEKTNPHGCAYGATKAGLMNFSGSLFDEARKYGVKVVNIEPDMTETNLYRNADFTVDENIAAKLTASDVAQAVMYILQQRDGMVVTDMVIKPQLHRIRRK